MFKARLFEMVFSRREELLQLYNAINGTDYQNPEELEINTLQNAIYMSMHNDISFLIDSRLSLYEHQSTYSLNLPLRFLFYVSDLYSDLTKDANLYGTKRVKIPTPKFIIFYNGREQQPDRTEYLLSDLFHPTADHPALELKAVMLNINKGHNQELMDACHTLRDYSEYVSRIRTYSAQMPLSDAVEKAITECIQENILLDFLLKNRAEAKAMSIYEYDEEKTMRMLREEAYEEAIEIGIRTTIETCMEFNASSALIIQKLISQFHLSEEKAQAYLNEYLNQNPKHSPL